MKFTKGLLNITGDCEKFKAIRNLPIIRLDCRIIFNELGMKKSCFY